MIRPTPLIDAFGPVQPPETLRDRVLRAHGRRRAVRRGMPVLALVATVVLLMPMRTVQDLDAVTDWQARSQSLEAAWRASADVAWLRSDARARPLVQRLERIDASLARAHRQHAGEAARLDGLWRERTEVLAALVETRTRGGTAVLL